MNHTGLELGCIGIKIRLLSQLCALEERVLTNPLHVLAERDLRQGLAVEEGNRITIKYRVSFEQFMNKEQASA